MTTTPGDDVADHEPGTTYHQHDTSVPLPGVSSDDTDGMGDAPGMGDDDLDALSEHGSGDVRECPGLGDLDDVGPDAGAVEPPD